MSKKRVYRWWGASVLKFVLKYNDQYTDAQMAAMLGVKAEAVHEFRRRHSIRKSEEFIKRINQRNARMRYIKHLKIEAEV